MTSKVGVLPQVIGSLSRPAPAARPGTLFVLGTNGGMSVAPDADFPLRGQCPGALDPPPEPTPRTRAPATNRNRSPHT